MTRIERKFRRSCLRKAKFITMKDAEDVIRRQTGAPSASDRKGLLQAYMCRFCTGYHIGHRRFSTSTA